MFADAVKLTVLPSAYLLSELLGEIDTLPFSVSSEYTSAVTVYFVFTVTDIVVYISSVYFTVIVAGSPAATTVILIPSSQTFSTVATDESIVHTLYIFLF